MILAPHYALVVAAGAGFAGLVAIFENSGLGQALVNGMAVVAASLVTSGVLWLKHRADRRADVERTSTSQNVEREKLVDARFAALITEMQEFHAEQVKGLQQSVLLAREMYEQEKLLVTEKNNLIAQQAAMIEQLRK